MNMMNSTFHTNQAPQQHNIVINNIPSYHDTNMGCVPAANMLHTSPIAVGVNYMQQQQQQQQSPTTAATTTQTSGSLDDSSNVTSNAVVFNYQQLDARNVQDKSALSADSTATTTQPNTIYITNNVSQQHHLPLPHTQQAIGTTSTYNNIRILSTVPSTVMQQQGNSCGVKPNSIGTELQQQLRSIDMVQLHSSVNETAHQAQLYQAHDSLQQLQQAHVPVLLPQQFSQQHFGTTPHHTTEHSMQLQLPTPTQDLYVPASDVNCNTSNATTTKLMPILANTSNKSTNSTVVLDRINICINNHYMDVASSSPSPGINSRITSKSPFSTQQPSPIIPAIEHKTLVESNLINSDDSESHTTIDEPDSTTTTTTPQTPPTTPENCTISVSVLPNSVDGGSPQSKMPSSSNRTDNGCDGPAVKTAKVTQSTTMKIDAQHSNVTHTAQQSSLFTPPTPPTPSSPTSNVNGYEINEDVFIQRQDGRFYLGTIIDCARQEYLIRFDDRSEQWCSIHEMRKLGSSQNNDEDNTRMCVTCKNTQSKDIVEICERCGRGYHRRCTTEIQKGNWFCKRCSKPMKIDLQNYSTTNNWQTVQEKRNVCYCGANKTSDEHVLHCCKCQNSYHIQCIECLKKKPLRGDSFFVFCCLLCNRGVEFLRRLQMTWPDIVQLTLFNLSLEKSQQQHQKYYHLITDIWPFVLKNLHYLPIPDEWLKYSEAQIMDKIKRALKDSSNRFISGFGQCYYGLRHMEAPKVPTFKVHANVNLTDEVLHRDMKLKLLNSSSDHHSESDLNINNAKKDRVKDIYEFCAEEEDTTDDEIPIKHIIEKTRKNAKAYMAKMNKLKIIKSKQDNENEIINDVPSASDVIEQQNEIESQTFKIENHNNENICNSKNNSSNNNTVDKEEECEKTKEPHTESNTLGILERSSRKRKAFTLSKSYKEIAGEAAAKRYENSRICDSSSDENSSSSRGTSLDVIIPPPKNFLGLNNPFRIVTPKKNMDSNKKSVGVFGCNGTMIKKSIFNTNSLNFSSKLAALKKAGIFPNLSTSDLVKAAGQPRTVRTIKRRLSAKDITIGPNQEIRRRRTRRISANVEVISTTTINTSSLFPIHAKDLNIPNIKWNSHYQQPQINLPKSTLPIALPSTTTVNSLESLARETANSTSVITTHGRRLRQRPQKNSPSNSRRSSISGTSTYSNSSNGLGTNTAVVTASLTNTSAATEDNIGSSDTTMQDLKQSVNKYFGAVNRIESGEQFSICAKRQLANGQMQFLIEWGEVSATSSNNFVT